MKGLGIISAKSCNNLIIVINGSQTERRLARQQLEGVSDFEIKSSRMIPSLQFMGHARKDNCWGGFFNLFRTCPIPIQATMKTLADLLLNITL